MKKIFCDVFQLLSRPWPQLCHTIFGHWTVIQTQPTFCKTKFKEDRTFLLNCFTEIKHFDVVQWAKREKIE